MRGALGAGMMTVTALMRGDLRRHAPVLFLWASIEACPTEHCNDLASYRIISSPDEATAAEAIAVLRSKGWNDFAPPQNLQNLALSLSPPVPAGKKDREGLADAHPANERALATLKSVRERRNGVRPSEPADPQDYLRKARSGGMYGYDPDEETALPDS